MKIYKREIVFDGSFIIQVENIYFFGKTGKKCVWEAVRRKTFGAIVAIFALTKEKEVVLEKSRRIPLDAHVIELPAGLMDRQGEAPEDVITRELREETGYEAKNGVIKILEGPFNSGLVSDTMTVFFSDGVEKVGEPMLEDAEDIEVITVPLDSLVDFCTTEHSDFLVDIKILNVLPVLEKRGLI